MLKPDQTMEGSTDGFVFLGKKTETIDDYAPLSSGDEEVVLRVHQRLIQEMDLSAVEKLGLERGRDAVEQGARTLVSEVAPGLFGERKELVVRRIVDDAGG